MEEDVSKSTIFILLVLTIVISALGAWTVLDAYSQTSQTLVYEGPGTAQARVNLVVQKSDVPILTAEPATGNVALQVQEVS